MLLLIEARDKELVLRPLYLWERVWGSSRGSAEEVKRELDKDERDREERLSKWCSHRYLCPDDDFRGLTEKAESSWM